MASDMRTDVGKELLFENHRVRVWEMALAPGEACHWHHHLNDYVFVYVTPDNVIETTPSPEATPGSGVYGQGFTQYTSVGSDGLPAHQIKNVGDKVHRQLIVELIGVSEAGATQPPANNGRSSLSTNGGAGSDDST